MGTLKYRLIVIGSLVAMVAGCAETTNNYTEWRTVDQQHKIAVKETNTKLNLVLNPGDAELSLAQKSAVVGFLQAWRNDGHGPIAISVPSGSSNAQIAVAGAAQTRELLFANGVGWQQMAGGHYQANGQVAPPVVLSFRRYVASAANCSVARSNLALSLGNRTPANFGCAMAVNTAAMIADPRDLLVPRNMQPAETDRRLTNYQKYVAGESTGAERSTDEEAAISDAVQ